MGTFSYRSAHFLVEVNTSHRFVTCCGLPSITLDGTKEDWEGHSERLDKLLTFGYINTHPHLHAWQGLLKSIITHFVDAFDAFSEPASPRAQEIIDFFRCGISAPLFTLGPALVISLAGSPSFVRLATRESGRCIQLVPEINLGTE
jgi:hypothetical protein